MADLSKLNTAAVAEEGAELDVLHPVENIPIGVKIVLAGKDSDRFQKFVRKQANKRTSKWRPGQKLSFTAEEQEQEKVDLLVACTISWSGVVMNGEEIPFSPEAAKELYSNPGFSWLVEQIDEFIGDREHFLPR